MIRKIVVDGNDGTGKSYRIEQLKKVFPGIEFEDRGIFSKATLNESLFTLESIKDFVKARDEFIDYIKNTEDTLYIIIDASVETCQKRILERGDSLEEEYHTKEDLEKFRNRFLYLVDLVKDIPNISNIMLINTDGL